jgi:hypothetical protein
MKLRKSETKTPETIHENRIVDQRPLEWITWEDCYGTSEPGWDTVELDQLLGPMVIDSVGWVTAESPTSIRLHASLYEDPTGLNGESWIVIPKSVILRRITLRRDREKTGPGLALYKRRPPTKARP